jgi:hypothetical protein
VLVAVVYLAVGWALTGRTYGARLPRWLGPGTEPAPMPGMTAITAS